MTPAPPAPAPPSAAGLPLAKLLVHAAQAVQAVRRGQSLTVALAEVPAPLRPGTQALAFHALRCLGASQHARQQLAARAPAPAIDALLLCALALLWPTHLQAPQAPRYEAHTVVDQAVKASRILSAPSSGFVNAILRRFMREQAAVVQAATQSIEGRWNHPLWWIKQLKRDWPAHWQQVLGQAQKHPPLCLRVNARRLTGPQYLEQLAANGLRGHLLPGPAWGGQAVVLEQALPVHLIPGFAQGLVSVQDAAAQRAAALLLGRASGQVLAPPPFGPGARVLDACAAPGGKTAHLLEAAGAYRLQLLALDVDAQRLAQVRGTLQRLGLEQEAQLRVADASKPSQWWDGQAFDAILLDAPCTASGIVRRHPDVRWLRRPTDIAALAATQARLLDALWPLLAPGGRLLYATCSVFKAEGQAQIEAFLQRQPGGAVQLVGDAPGHLLPVVNNPNELLTHSNAAEPGTALEDGFFYALMQKV